MVSNVVWLMSALSIHNTNTKFKKGRQNWFAVQMRRQKESHVNRGEEKRCGEEVIQQPERRTSCTLEEHKKPLQKSMVVMHRGQYSSIHPKLPFAHTHTSCILNITHVNLMLLNTWDFRKLCVRGGKKNKQTTIFSMKDMPEKPQHRRGGGKMGGERRQADWTRPENKCEQPLAGGDHTRMTRADSATWRDINETEKEWISVSREREREVANASPTTLGKFRAPSWNGGGGKTELKLMPVFTVEPRYNEWKFWSHSLGLNLWFLDTPFNYTANKAYQGRGVRGAVHTGGSLGFRWTQKFFF